MPLIIFLVVVVVTVSIIAIMLRKRKSVEVCHFLFSVVSRVSVSLLVG